MFVCLIFKRKVDQHTIVRLDYIYDNSLDTGQEPMQLDNLKLLFLDDFVVFDKSQMFE